MAEYDLSPVRRRFTLDAMQEMTPGANYHTDQAAAEKAGFGEPNVGSAQFLPLLYEMIEDTFDLNPETLRGKFSVRFRRPVLSTVETVANGTYEVAPDGQHYSLTMALTQGDEDVCRGTAEIAIPQQ